MRHVGYSVYGRRRREQNTLPPKQPGGERAIAPRDWISEPVRFVDDHRPGSGIRRAASTERFVARHPKGRSDLASGGNPLFAQRGGNQRVHRPPRGERESRGDADVRLPGPDGIGEDRAAEPSGCRDRAPERERLIGPEPERRRVLRFVGQQRARQRRGHARRRACRSRAEPCRERVGDVPE